MSPTNNSPNADQILYWNETVASLWTQRADYFEQQIGHFGEVALAKLGPKKGERILDVGCGGGITTLSLARRVEHDGRVLGIDISRPLLALAEQRLRQQVLPQASFVVADAQVFEFEESTFDAVYSRFGVMFFADPIAAFANIRRALVSNGRLCFVCWRSRDDNPFMYLPLGEIAKVIDVPKPAVGAPGPASLGDPTRITSILTAAGFRQLEVQPYNAKMTIGGANLDETVELLLSALAAGVRERSSSQFEQLKISVREVFKPHHSPVGLVLPGAVWIVNAVK